MSGDLGTSIILTMAPIFVAMIALVAYGAIKNSNKNKSRSKHESDALIEAQAMLAKYQKEQAEKQAKADSEKKEEKTTDKATEKAKEKPEEKSAGSKAAKPKEDTVLRSDIPLELYENLSDKEKEKLKVIETETPREKLIEEKEKLLKRLEEIEKELEEIEK